MKIGKMLYVKDKNEWRTWLTKNHRKEKEIWLIYYKKSSGRPRIPYNDAVEEALCFGWIDGQIRKIDGKKYVQRYSPRASKSRWSVINIGRATRMIKQGKMTAWGLNVYQDGMKTKERVPSSRNFSIPPYLRAALAKNKRTWANFQNFAPSAKLAYVYWITAAKTAETRQKRIDTTVKSIAQNKKFGEK